MIGGGPAARRAERLVQLYPRSWRERYGEEFVELLVYDISERPRSWRRSADVVRGSAVARLDGLGLTGPLLEPGDQVGASLSVFTWCLAIFLGFGVTMWTQLAVAGRWSAPERPVTSAAMIAMSVALATFLVLAALAAAPVAWTVLRRLVAERSQEMLRPTVLMAAGVLALFFGGWHFGVGWPGAGGHNSAAGGLVPATVASFSWASTLSVSTHWAHPSAFALIPPAEIAWMFVSPLAFTCVVLGAVKAIRISGLSERALLFETRVATLASPVMVVLLAGCCVWMVDGGPGPGDLYGAGNLDLFGVLTMAAAMALGRLATRRARRGTLALASGSSGWSGWSS